MPPKPAELARGAGSDYYYIDFSLRHQLELAGAAPPANTDDSPSKHNSTLCILSSANINP